MPTCVRAIRRGACAREAAQAAGLAFERRWNMPANNLMLAFRKPADAEPLG